MSKANYIPDLVDTWLEEDNLMLLEAWARDGYTMEDIANRIGIDRSTIYDWQTKYPEIAQALRRGREIVDYMVENALLKSALGYKTKEVKVTTVMRYGKVVETTKEVTNKEQAPNVSAIQMWLYNRNKDKWKNMNAKQNMFDEMQEDSSIEVIVRRASKNETGESEDDEAWEDEMNESVEVRKRTAEETAQVEKQKRKEKREAKKAAEQHTEYYDVNDEEEYDPSLDEWPEDWEDDEE